MATVLTKPQSNALKVEAKLSQELAQATSRIRWTDLLTGGLTLVTLVLGYTLLAVLADKLLRLLHGAAGIELAPLEQPVVAPPEPRARPRVIQSP